MNNNGNIKLTIILFLLGSSSAFLLVPAVMEKENLDISSIKGDSVRKITTEENNLANKFEKIKTEYIEVPINKVTETTTEITKYINNPEKILSNKTLAETEPSNNLASNNIVSKHSSPDAVIKITKEMVDNCRIITDEYNKVKN